MDYIELVGSGTTGFHISHPLDCNIFLVDCGNQYVLVDAGTGLNPELIVENIEKKKVPMDQVTHILLTHAHGDHAVGASFFQKNYGVQLISSKEVAPWLEHANCEKTSINEAINVGFYPSNLPFEKISINKTVCEGDIIKIGNKEFHIIETPGHAKGHISFICNINNKKVLLSGDTIFSGGKIILQNIWDCCIQDYAKTIEKLNNLNIDSLYPGHGPYIENQAYEHIEKAHQCFQTLQIPPNY